MTGSMWELTVAFSDVFAFGEPAHSDPSPVTSAGLNEANGAVKGSVVRTIRVTANSLESVA